MSYNEYVDEFRIAQERQVGPYIMFIIDGKGSKKWSKEQFETFYRLRLETANALKDIKGIVDISNARSTIPMLMILGDAMATVIDTREVDARLLDISNTFALPMYKAGLDFHFRTCYVETLDYDEAVGKLYHGYAFAIMEQLMKGKTLEEIGSLG